VPHPPDGTPPKIHLISRTGPGYHACIERRMQHWRGSFFLLEAWNAGVKKLQKE
jgi:hypothetical protein